MDRKILLRKTSTGYDLVYRDHLPKHDRTVYIAELSRAHALFVSQGKPEYPGSNSGRGVHDERDINPARIRLRLRRCNIEVDRENLWDLHVLKNGREQQACTINDSAIDILKNRFGESIFGDHNADMLDRKRRIMYAEIERLRAEVDILEQQLVAHISTNPPAGETGNGRQVSIGEWLYGQNSGSEHSLNQKTGSESTPEPG